MSILNEKQRETVEEQQNNYLLLRCASDTFFASFFLVDKKFIWTTETLIKLNIHALHLYTYDIYSVIIEDKEKWKFWHKLRKFLKRLIDLW